MPHSPCHTPTAVCFFNQLTHTKNHTIKQKHTWMTGLKLHGDEEVLVSTICCALEARTAHAKFTAVGSGVEATHAPVCSHAE